jgi:hypothetical protein
MNQRTMMEWLIAGGAGLALGLGVALAENVFSLPKVFSQAFFLVFGLVVAGFAAWAAWGYYRGRQDDDYWD